MWLWCYLSSIATAIAYWNWAWQYNNNNRKQINGFWPQYNSIFFCVYMVGLRNFPLKNIHVLCIWEGERVKWHSFLVYVFEPFLINCVICKYRIVNVVPTFLYHNNKIILWIVSYYLNSLWASVDIRTVDTKHVFLLFGLNKDINIFKSDKVQCLGEQSKKMSHIVEKVHNFLEPHPPPLG